MHKTRDISLRKYSKTYFQIIYKLFDNELNLIQIFRYFVTNNNKV